MKTDDLVALLSSDARSVSYQAGLYKMLATLAVGALVAFLMMNSWLGIRADMGDAVALPMFWMKLAFPAVLLVVGTGVLLRIGYPGLRLGWSTMALIAPFAVLWVLALIALANASPETRPGLILGSTWEKCTISIVFLAVPTGMAAFWALKQLAPTRLRAAGAMAGLFAGASAASVYALHCPEMDLPFLAVWYALGILIPTMLGWLLGPWLLRW